MGELLHYGFLTRAAQRPEEVALLWSDGSMTYGELAGRAGELAGRLQALGAEPNSLVGISIARGWEQVVAVLGVLMSGAAYLPIDTELPEERRHHLIEQGGAALVVTGDDAEDWPDGITQVEAAPPRSDVPSVTAEQPVQEPDALAYVIYTSGSTGSPKGVALSHGAAWNTVEDINERFGVSAADRVLCLSSLSFDLSVFDLFGLLAVGGALVLPDACSRLDPRHWLQLCEEHKVTIWNSVPTLMELAIEQLEMGAPHPISLRLVLMSGDWIPVALPDRIRAFAKEAELVSLGGATEAAIWSIYFPIREVDPAWTSIPYGKPLRNQSWEVLNDSLNPCPAHVTGDLYIGGMGLAKGYWRDDERTAASFITHPRTGQRLYRTGDLGRYMSDGNIEFLGRNDSQVKIGGHRIELGEIESHLGAHPDVRNAAVVAIGEERGRRRLVAFVVRRQSHEDGDHARARPTGEESDAETVDLGDLGAELSGTEDVIVDPMERLEFKLRRHGLRRLEEGSVLELPPTVDAEERDRTYRDRRASLRFTEGPVSLRSLGEFLGTLRSVEDESGLSKYRYGSAGGLYPVQIHLSVGPGEVEGVPTGAYYYDPESHALLGIPRGTSLGVDSHLTPNRKLAGRSAFTVFFVADLNAMEPLYGASSKDFSLIEAGLIAQLLEGEANRCGIGFCQVAVSDSPRIREAFALGESHVVLHALVCGRSETRVAYSNGKTGPDGDGLWIDLRQWLASKLPQYMVPSQFVSIEQIPLTSNGKVDRKVLSSMAGVSRDVEGGSNGTVRSHPEGAAVDGSISAVLDVVGAALADILESGDAWIVDPDNAFVEMGLDSLGAVQLRNRLEAAFGLTLPATIVFDHPTPNQISQRVVEEFSGLGGRSVISPDGKLVQIERQLYDLAATDSGREEVIRNLRRLLGVLDRKGATMDSDLQDATDDEIFELVDRELGSGGG